MWEPYYRITDEITTKLTEIAQIREKVATAKLLPTREAVLRRKATVKIAHTSTSIEGNELKEYQVQALVEGKRVAAKTREIQEVENYLNALQYIDILAQKKQFKTIDILKIHKKAIEGLVEKNKTGRFRQGPVYVVNVSAVGQERLIYTPPPAKDVQRLVDEFITWLKKAEHIHPVLQAGLLHYQLASIHPFTDGNGRTARLITLLYLYQSDWAFRKVLVLDEYYNSNRKAYYQALDTGKTYKARQGVDITKWLTYFVDGFWKEAVRVHEQVLRLQTVGTEGMTEMRLDKEELSIIDFVVTTGRITSDDVVDILEVPKRTAQAKLQKLENLRVLEKRGAGPATHYVLNTTV